MTDTTTAAILVAIPLILAAVGNLVVVIITATRVSATEKKVDKVVEMTNGNMGLQKRSLAEVTAAKAVITKDPADVEAAKIAKADAMAHDASEMKSNQTTS